MASDGDGVAVLPKSYVIRIYRRPAGGTLGLVGLVEAEGTGRQRHFSSVEELWEILAEIPSEVPGTREPKGMPKTVP